LIFINGFYIQVSSPCVSTSQSARAQVGQEVMNL